MRRAARFSNRPAKKAIRLSVVSITGMTVLTLFGAGVAQASETGVAKTVSATTEDVNDWG
ncbi:hypothetical protein ABZT23_39455 [Streptomyces sp. NPDC005386]|uniref:hypothetical protein n=1 Tax=Streptomyces sp. NPDC005386 TaxID=3154562 RepID=UPI0033B8093F